MQTKKNIGMPIPAPFALSNRPVDGNKGTFGRVTVVGGCERYPGAPVLSGKAAYRAGCGLVEMMTPAIVRNCGAAGFTEAIWNCEFFETPIPKLSAKTTLIVGPGLGDDEVARSKVPLFLCAAAEAGSYALIDADGLNALARIPNWSDNIHRKCVLTPHPGEMSRLCGSPITSIQNNRQHTAEHFAAQWQQIVLLKGANTVVAAPDKDTFILPFASSALAVAGSGDVLSGIIGGLIAQRMEPFEAACLGAWLHAASGLIAAQTLGCERSVMAGDLINAIPKAIELAE